MTTATLKAQAKSAKPAPTVDMLDDVPAATAIVDDTLSAEQLANMIATEGAAIGASQKENCAKVQNWLECTTHFLGKDVGLILGQIMDLAQHWHGINASRLEKYIRDGLKNGKLSKKGNDGEQYWCVTCKPQNLQKVKFTTQAGNWFEFEKASEPKEITLAEAVAKFVAQREKKGDSPEDIAIAMEQVLEVEPAE